MKHFSTSTRFLAVVAFQFVILLGLIGYKQFTVVTGTTVTLAVRPVDPYDIFRGDYVRINYSIAELDRALFTAGGTATPAPTGSAGTGIREDLIAVGPSVYLELARDDTGIWRPVRARAGRFSPASGNVVIKGTSDQGSIFLPTANQSTTVRVNYGIEDIFVPENAGKAIERAAADRVTVEVNVDRFGNAVPRRILIDGQPYDISAKD